ncbi:unnamed protein product [Nippostrongylus brasiliensis]|uniref:Myosin_tail_1 domain-containing protein n=1 Tax=Nippostrongylus brasiliensis TaxID=27835 RepID=A0A0N4Y145_NIPBR|nr:unnamed protein product [Nippostrongylus brasiliensis]
MLADQVQNLRNEAEQLKETAEEFEGFKDYLKDRAQERTAEVENLQQTISDLQRRIRELEEQLQEAQQHHQEEENPGDLVEVDRVEDNEDSAEHKREVYVVKDHHQEAQ